MKWGGFATVAAVAFCSFAQMPVVLAVDSDADTGDADAGEVRAHLLPDGSWRDEGTAVPEVLGSVRPGQEVVLSAHWTELVPGLKTIECRLLDELGQPAVLIRFEFEIDDSGNSHLWCNFTVPDDYSAYQARVLMVLSSGQQTEVQLPVRRTPWQRLKARVSDRDSRSAQPVVFDSTVMRLHDQRLAVDFDREIRRPGEAKAFAPPGERVYHLGHWVGLKTDQVYELRCEAQDPAGTIRHVSRFRFQPTTPNWEAWCRHELSIFERPGPWQFRLYLDDLGMPPMALTVRHSLQSRLRRWLQDRPAVVSVPVDRPRI